MIDTNNLVHAPLKTGVLGTCVIADNQHEYEVAEMTRKCSHEGRQADASFFATARNAFAAQMEYGWIAVLINQGIHRGCWRVVTVHEDDAKMMLISGNTFPDPFTALAAAYERKKRQEGKP